MQRKRTEHTHAELQTSISLVACKVCMIDAKLTVLLFSSRMNSEGLRGRYFSRSILPAWIQGSHKVRCLPHRLVGEWQLFNGRNIAIGTKHALRWNPPLLSFIFPTGATHLSNQGFRRKSWHSSCISRPRRPYIRRLRHAHHDQAQPITHQSLEHSR